LIEQLCAALAAARRDRDTARTLRSSTFVSDLRNRELELRREELAA